MESRTACGTLSGVTFHGASIARLSTLQPFVAAHESFFDSDSLARGGLPRADPSGRGYEFRVSLRFGHIDAATTTASKSCRARASFFIDVRGLDTFSCEGVTALNAELRWRDGKSDLELIHLDLTPCPRFLQDPGFASDLQGATFLDLDVVDGETVMLQRVCPNLPQLHRVRKLPPPTQSPLGPAVPRLATPATLALPPGSAPKPFLVLLASCAALLLAWQLWRARRHARSHYFKVQPQPTAHQAAELPPG